MAGKGELGGSRMSNVLKAKEDLLKTAEQLENEKREIIASRMVKLNLEGKRKEDLMKEAEDFYQILVNIHTQIYDLSEKHERQRYDMMELAERARQIEKGKAKTRKSNIVHTGLGGSVFPWLTEQCSQAPQKISLFSRYERVTDRRTFKDRRDVWAVEKTDKEFVPEKPKAKIRQVEDLPKDPKIIKSKSKPAKREEEEEEQQQQQQQKQEENNEESAKEEEPQEEEAPPAEQGEEEEAPADEEAAEE